MKLSINKILKNLNLPAENGTLITETEINSLGEISITSRQEALDYISEFLAIIENPVISRNKSQNKIAWENGWNENLEIIKKNGFSAENVRPRYLRKHDFFRFDREIYKNKNPFLEFELFCIARKLLFTHYLSSFVNVYELGCGSGGNLHLLSTLFPDINLVGTDWVQPSVDIANAMGQKLNRNIKGQIFDFTDPKDLIIPKNSAVITIHALEQIGRNHYALLDYLIDSKPDLVLHLEPVIELYDPLNSFDNLAIKYTQKRNYLEGFLPSLEQKEKEGKIELIEVLRPEIGGVWHEASLIIWRPI